MKKKLVTSLYDIISHKNVPQSQNSFFYSSVSFYHSCSTKKFVIKGEYVIKATLFFFFTIRKTNFAVTTLFLLIRIRRAVQLFDLLKFFLQYFNFILVSCTQSILFYFHIIIQWMFCITFFIRGGRLLGSIRI